MKRTIPFLVILVIGLIVGVLGGVYFMGASHEKPLPGTKIGPPEPGQDTSASVTVGVEEKFFDPLLNTIFRQLGPPQLKLAEAQRQNEQPLKPAVFQGTCDNVFIIAADDGDVKTRVRFTGGKITAPVAFTGSYNVLGSCVHYKGWAQTSIALSFDQAKQIVFGRLDIDQITLDDSPFIVSNLVTAFVRKTITEQVNPFEVLPVSQLAISVPLRVSGGTLKAHVKDVRADVQEGTLKLYLTYDFNAERDGNRTG